MKTNKVKELEEKIETVTCFLLELDVAICKIPKRNPILDEDNFYKKTKVDKIADMIGELYDFPKQYPYQLESDFLIDLVGSYEDGEINFKTFLKELKGHKANLNNQ